ncbi:MAG: Uridine phosphorylase [Calditrichaeota bacterium]|nr:Uridine phosphorylase [Calditrichota bacterium]
MQLEHLDLKQHRAGFAVLTGNPKRVERIANVFDSPEFVSDRRGLDTWRAQLAPEDDRGVFIVGAGMGSPSLAIVFEELAVSGVHSFIRVGTCGPLQDRIGVGEITAASGVVRDEGTSKAYVREDFPAVADHELLFALRDELAGFDWPVHIGITHAKDAFYTQKPDFALDREANEKHWRLLRDAGVLVTEMESSVLYVLASLRRVRALALLVASGMDRKNPRTAEGVLKAAELTRRVFLRAPEYRMPPGFDPARRVDQSILDEL